MRDMQRKGARDSAFTVRYAARKGPSLKYTLRKLRPRFEVRCQQKKSIQARSAIFAIADRLTPCHIYIAPLTAARRRLPPRLLTVTPFCNVSNAARLPRLRLQ